MSDQHKSQSGFTLVEVLIVVAVSVPVLLGVLATSERVSRTVSSSERNADAATAGRKVAERAGRMIRAAKRSTFRVRATQADVDASKASTVGEWITVTELDPRPNLQFQSASGTLSFNATSLTSPRAFEFVRDSNETANGTDDDGDGLVDEGKLFLHYEGTRVLIADMVETCSFQIDGRAVRFSLQCARRDNSGQVHRAVAAHVWFVRNP